MKSGLNNNSVRKELEKVFDILEWNYDRQAVDWADMRKENQTDRLRTLEKRDCFIDR